MAFNYMLLLRGLQILFAIIVIGLAAYVAHYYNDFTIFASPSSVNFLIFTSIWTFLVTAYLSLVPGYFPRFSHKFAVLALDAVTMLFWFAGFIAVAVFVSAVSGCEGRLCRSAQAAAVFGAFEWLLFLATTVLATMHVLKTRNTNSTKAAPNMEVHAGV